MNDIDRQIEEALNEEDRTLFAELGEQGLFTQWFSVYRGRQAWIAIMSTIVMFFMLSGAVYAGWNFFRGSGSVLEASAWAGLAVTLMMMISFMKVWFWMRMESNRVIREVKRLELQIARLQAK